MKKIIALGSIFCCVPFCLIPTSCSTNPVVADTVSLSWQGGNNTLDETHTSIVANASLNIKGHINPTVTSWSINNSLSNVSYQEHGNSIIFSIDNTQTSIGGTIKVSCQYNSIKSNELSINVSAFVPFNYANEIIFSKSPDIDTLNQQNKSITLTAQIRSKSGSTVISDYVDWSFTPLPLFINSPSTTTGTNSLTFSLVNNQSTIQGSYSIQASYKPGDPTGAASKTFILNTEDWEFWDPTWIPETDLSFSGTTLNGLKSGVNISNYSILHIPRKTTSIKNNAFQGKSEGTVTTYPLHGITNIDFSEAINLTSIGLSAFDQASDSINGSLVLPSSLKSIGSYGFCNLSFSTIDMRHCASLKTLTQAVFSDNNNLQHIYFNDNLEKIEDAGGGGFGAFQTADNRSLFNDTIVFPKKIKYIGAQAFQAIGNNSAAGVDKFVTLDFSACEQLTTIGYSAFGNSCLNYNSTPLTFPNTVTSIGKLCFFKAKNIKTVNIPPSLSTLGSNCFSESDINTAHILKTNGVYPYNYSDGDLTTGEYSNLNFGKWLRVTDIEPRVNGTYGTNSINGAHVEVPSSLLPQYQSSWSNLPWIAIQGY